ncbi:P-loop containing nucleoside triphosphate hydrolase protein [Paraphysoderma sedebokerense]|nr:P-loop containing nucleoside triphosphate hydrolase protein [Paraphysoderma sedebokerense]
MNLACRAHFRAIKCISRSLLPTNPHYIHPKCHHLSHKSHFSSTQVCSRGPNKRPFDRKIPKLIRNALNSSPTKDTIITLPKPSSLTEMIRRWRDSNDVVYKAQQMGLRGKNLNVVIQDFQKAVTAGEVPIDLEGPVDTQLNAAFVDFVHKYLPQDAVEEFKTLCDISDLRYPTEWFPAARATPRKIIMHVGPTNSGKTYNALLRYQQAKSGVYCGPLRLLAHEIYEKMNATGVKCNLVTGEERKIVDRQAGHISCTVEMADINRKLDVAVIDEIQLIGDPSRGWAWTNALLGLQAKEIHLCGEPTAVPLVKRICESINEPVEVKEYTRLSPLEISPDSLRGNLKMIQKGDCVVAFSRKDVFLLKREIESVTGKKCAVVYGALPPETRSEQARLFNDPNSEYEVLVATDAIGMGLNLNISRIIFSTLSKFDGQNQRWLSVSSTRQIAGRAGRFGTETSSGIATTLSQKDTKGLKELMNADPIELQSAGLQPLGDQVELFASQFAMDGMRFSALLSKFEALARLDGNMFFLCNLEEQKAIADLLEDFDMTIRDRYSWVLAPVNLRDQLSLECYKKFAEFFVKGQPINIIKVFAKHPRIKFHVNQRIVQHLEEMFPLNALPEDEPLPQQPTVFQPHLLPPSPTPEETSPSSPSSPDSTPPPIFPTPANPDKFEDLIFFKSPSNSTSLTILEQIHRSLMMFLWLRQRFKLHPSFSGISDDLAAYLKRDCERAIDQGLRMVSWDKKKHKRRIQRELELEEDEETHDENVGRKKFNKHKSTSKIDLPV